MLVVVVDYVSPETATTKATDMNPYYYTAAKQYNNSNIHNPT